MVSKKEKKRRRQQEYRRKKKEKEYKLKRLIGITKREVAVNKKRHRTNALLYVMNNPGCTNGQISEAHPQIKDIAALMWDCVQVGLVTSRAEDNRVYYTLPNKIKDAIQTTNY